MRNRRRVAWIGLAFSVSLVAAACGGGDEGGEPEEGGTIEVAGQEANDHGAVDVSGKDEVAVEQDDFYFEPTVISGEAGQTVTVELENEGRATHTFTVDALGVDVVVEAGQTASAEVTFPDSGALLFYCRFHGGQGMRGGLSVGGDLNPAEGSTGGGGYVY